MGFLNVTPGIPEMKFKQNGVACPSGVLTVVLGPIKSGPYFNKAFGVFNHSMAALTVNVDINMDPHGDEALQGAAGSQTAVDPNPAYWVTVSDAAMVVSGTAAAACQLNTPCMWVRLSTTATLPNTTVPGFMIALTM